jgi:hypothetical protein
MRESSHVAPGEFTRKRGRLLLHVYTSFDDSEDEQRREWQPLFLELAR